MPVAAPASVIPDRENEYYKSEDECSTPSARRCTREYKTIVDAGFLVQLDDARVMAVTFDRMVPPASKEEYRKWAGKHVAAMNHGDCAVFRRIACATMCAGGVRPVHTPPMCRCARSSISGAGEGRSVFIEGGQSTARPRVAGVKDVKLPDGKVLIPEWSATPPASSSILTWSPIASPAASSWDART